MEGRLKCCFVCVSVLQAALMERPQKSVCLKGQKILFERTVNTVLLQLVKNVS